ncbi:predicted protein [Chaetoceros tenuissimus]|uniref:Uncharacterized protein n=1 Tax=Chaetoceros tenuissimus TaxID=426638 RepID=A0AAD3D282_9STRA|nr:predicted protein [Chaetoceros tenuissimus]
MSVPKKKVTKIVIVAFLMLCVGYIYNEDSKLSRFLSSSKDNDKEEGTSSPNLSHVDRIYYINMDHRTDKQDWMESWLEPFSKKYSIPYYRISGKRGDPDHDDCGSRPLGNCMAVNGLIYSNFEIMDNHNTTGITIVLEDDYEIKDYPKLLKSLSMAPDDWDVIRFDLWQGPHGNFPRIDMGDLGNGFQTVSPPEESQHHCGGTHITVWRGDKVDKLHKHWDSHPRLGVDCRLAADNITSYALMTGVGALKRGMGGDIPHFRRLGLGAFDYK